MLWKGGVRNHLLTLEIARIRPSVWECKAPLCHRSLALEFGQAEQMVCISWLCSHSAVLGPLLLLCWNTCTQQLLSSGRKGTVEHCQEQGMSESLSSRCVDTERAAFFPCLGTLTPFIFFTVWTPSSMSVVNPHFKYLQQDLVKSP